MRLPRATRALLILIGLAVTAVAIVGLVVEWPLAAPVVILVFGLLFLGVAAIGSVPNMNWREGTFLWPDPRLYERLDALEKALAEQKNLLTAQTQRLDGEALGLDYIFSKLPVPLDDDGEPVSLDSREESLEETRHQISRMQYEGEGYDDGFSVQGLEMMAEDTARDIRLESRRQRARKVFGPARYDGHHPTRDPENNPEPQRRKSNWP